jgi:hypothetical protein
LRYDIAIFTKHFSGDTATKSAYIDDVIVALARFGYSPYLDEDDNIHFMIYEEEKIDIDDRENDDIVAKNIL